MRSMLHAGLLALALAAPAAAQDDDPAASRGTSFEAVEGPTREDVAGGPLLVGAYGAILVLLIVYVTWLGRLHTGSMREIERLKLAVARAESGPAERPTASKKKTAEKDV
jgi:hypothetical protein